MNEELFKLQLDLIYLTNPQLFVDLSGRITDFSGISEAEFWQIEDAKDRIKKEMQFIIDVKNDIY